MGKKLLGRTNANPKGHFENQEFVLINNRILASVNGSWDRPPSPLKIKNNKMNENHIRRFIRENKLPIWGLKDPRTLLTYDIWKPYLEETSEITYIFVHRPFEESIMSLVHRNHFSIEKSRKILIPYLNNKNKLRTRLKDEGADIIDVNFENLLKNPEIFVEEINKRTNQKPDYHLPAVKNFLDTKLKKF
ncbi:sulfotransferase family protein [Metabacillus sediminilitoris]|nr:sulfotransferase family protein [Metabacillus sediminilitoris]